MVECARALHAHAERVALTLGAKGSLLMHDGVLHPVEGVPVEAVDTTGAGDMYAAGILYGLTNGLSWPQAGRLASHAAARVVSTLGARLPRKLSPSEILQMASAS
jgi:sugar/nucleoside kinase (ribokinase family)